LLTLPADVSSALLTHSVHAAKDPLTVVAVHPQQVELAALLILTMSVTLALIPVVIFRVLARQSEDPRGRGSRRTWSFEGMPIPTGYRHTRIDVTTSTGRRVLYHTRRPCCPAITKQRNSGPLGGLVTPSVRIGLG
jgi:hypothetical protein